MVDVIGLNNGMTPRRGVIPISYYDLDAGGGMLTDKDYHSKGIDSMHDKFRQQQPVPMAMFEKAFNRSTSSMVLPVKTDADCVIMGKPESDRNGGAHAPSGYARNQLKGLAYDINKPNDLDNIMPIANNFFHDSVNVFGNLR